MSCYTLSDQLAITGIKFESSKLNPYLSKFFNIFFLSITVHFLRKLNEVSGGERRKTKRNRCNQK